MEKRFIEEDWEREALKDEIYLREEQKSKEQLYWEWYVKTEGKIVIENPDGTKTEVDEILPDYKLPF